MKGHEGYEKELAPYEYTVTIFNDFDNTSRTVHGVTFAKTYVGAMRHIWDYYGTSMEDVKITANIANTVYEFGEDQGCMFKINEVEIR